MALSESQRAQLDGIVSKMAAAGEPDESIRFVVSDFKSKNEKPSALESFGSGLGETSVPGAKAGEGLGAQLKAAPERALESFGEQATDPVALLKSALLPGASHAVDLAGKYAGAAKEAVQTGSVRPFARFAPSGVDDAAKQILAMLSPEVGAQAGDIVERAGGAVGSGDPNELARSGGNVAGILAQILLAKKAPKAAAKTAEVGGRAAAATGRGAGAVASALENPAVQEAISGPVGRSIAAGAGTALGGGAGAVIGALGGPALANLGAKGSASILRLVERALGKPAPEVAKVADALAEKAPAGAPVASEAAPAAKGSPKVQVQFADLPEPVQRLLNDATKKPAERQIAREAIEDARKGDPTRLDALARQLEATQPQPVAPAPPAAAPAADLEALLRNAEPQVPGPAASLEDLLRLSVEQARLRKQPQAAAAAPAGIESLLLPDGQRGWGPGYSGKSGGNLTSGAVREPQPMPGVDPRVGEALRLLFNEADEAAARKTLQKRKN